MSTYDTDLAYLRTLEASDCAFFSELFADALRVTVKAAAARGRSATDSDRRSAALRARLVLNRRNEWQARYLAIQRGRDGRRRSEVLGRFIVDRLGALGDIASGCYFDAPAKRGRALRRTHTFYAGVSG